MFCTVLTSHLAALTPTVIQHEASICVEQDVEESCLRVEVTSMRLLFGEIGMRTRSQDGKMELAGKEKLECW